MLVIVFFYLLFRISNMVISIAIMTENVTRNPYCPCRPIDECLNEIRSNSKNSELVAFSSPCESSDGIMIRCCTFHTSINDLFLCVSQNTLKEQIKCILHDKLRMIRLINSLGQMKHSSLMMEESASEILSSSVNSVHSEYTGPSDETDLKSTESNNSKKKGADTLQTVQRMTTVMNTNRVQSPVANATYSNNLETNVTKINLIDEFPEKILPPPIGNSFFVKTDAHSLFIPVENAKYVQPLSDNTDSNPYVPKQEIYIENVDETKACYEKQSMVSSSISKNVPTTPAVNSFEQKTSSETFLSLDRISTQPININTPTNKSEAPRNDSDINVFTIVKKSPLFSENAQKNKQLVTHKINSQLIRDSRNKLQEETNWNHREFPFIENTVEIILPRRDDPLQASTRNKRMTAPIISQKDILNKNTEEAEYKNNTTQKKNTKPSLENNQSEVTIKEERKGSANENATKDPVNVTTATLPMQKFRFPPKFLPARLKPRKEEHNSTRAGNFQNLDRFSSSHFQHFYKAKEGLLLKINNITEFEKIKPMRFELLSNASQAYLSRNKNIKALKNSEARDAIDIKMSNISALNDSISVDKNDSYEYSAPNLQNASLTTNKIASHLNTSSQEIEKSMQTEAMYNNDTASSTSENNSKVSSETIVQKITENLKQLSEINGGINIIATHILTHYCNIT